MKTYETASIKVINLMNEDVCTTSSNVFVDGEEHIYGIPDTWFGGAQ